jgi:hypothetical protein
MNAHDLSKEFVADYLSAYKASGFPKENLFSLGVVQSLMQTAFIEGFQVSQRLNAMKKEDAFLEEKIGIKYLDETRDL